MGATAMIGSSLVGGLMGGYGAEQGAKAQANAANNATAMQKQMFEQTRNSLAPYMNQGAQAYGQLMQQMPDLTKAFSPTMADLENMPGYKFQLQQGLEAAQNGYAAKGLGSSGAAMKGAAQYAQGLASSDLGQLANIYYQNQANAYNRLMGAASLGENAAAGAGNIGANYAGGMANTITGAGNAIAAGDVGMANALSGGINNGINNAIQYGMYQKMFGK